MMLKSFGIDPEAIKKQFEETAAKTMAKVDEIHESQTRIEAKLDALLKIGGNLDAMNAIESEPEAQQHAEPELVTQGRIDA